MNRQIFNYMEMKSVETMNHDEFVSYIRELISDRKKLKQEEMDKILQRSLYLLNEPPKVTIDIKNVQVVKKGMRVNICYDGHYYFLSSIDGKPFAPRLTKEELYDDTYN